MGNATRSTIGSIGWADLTVKEAEKVRDFYRAVVGWSSVPVDMGGYSDYMMKTSRGENVAGVCHARGTNKDLPPYWLIYFAVADLAKSMEECVKLGGKVTVGPKSMGEMGRYCIIQDPAGAFLALLEPQE